jgi:hypothetical protein
MKLEEIHLKCCVSSLIIHFFFLLLVLEGNCQRSQCLKLSSSFLNLVIEESNALRNKFKSFLAKEQIIKSTLPSLPSANK